MNPFIKRHWISALRSGEYAQARGAFVREGRGGDEFCCLAVLTNLYVEATGDADVWTERQNEGEFSEALPVRVMLWAELDSQDPQLGKYTAMQWNDGGDSNGPIEARDFEQIADLVEEHL